MRMTKRHEGAGDMKKREAAPVTLVSGKTVSRGARRAVGLVICGLLAVMAAGCSSSGPTLGEAASTAALAPPQQASTKPVTFAPVIGAPAKVSTKLNEMLVAQAGQKSMPVVPPKDAEYTIRGYLVAASDPKGTKLSYIWDVSDKANKRKRIQGEELIEGKKGGDPWAAVDDAAMQRVAGKAVGEISDWLPKNGPAPALAQNGNEKDKSQADAPAAAGPVQVASLNNDAPAPAQRTDAGSSTGPVLAAQTSQPAKEAAPSRPQETLVTAAAPAAEPAVAVVPTVGGAPGDGGQSLSAAMRKHLQSAGIKLGDKATGPNVWTVKGSVEMGAAAGGQQPITIHWTVTDPSGKTLDKAVVQRNKVSQGSLDGAWGPIADLAAGEAAKSIARLIPKPTG